MYRAGFRQRDCRAHRDGVISARCKWQREICGSRKNWGWEHFPSFWERIYGLFSLQNARTAPIQVFEHNHSAKYLSHFCSVWFNRVWDRISFCIMVKNWNILKESLLPPKINAASVVWRKSRLWGGPESLLAARFSRIPRKILQASLHLRIASNRNGIYYTRPAASVRLHIACLLKNPENDV